MKNIKKAQLKLQKIKIWVDDIREPILDYIWVKTPEQAIELLKTNRVSHISLDHDLGFLEPERTGYTIASWIEEHAYLGDLSSLSWQCHSANSVGRSKIAQALMNADKYWSSKRD